MSDIRIVRRRNIAYGYGISERGRMWIIDNIDDDKVEIKFAVQSELVNDMIELIEEAKLTVKEG